jgi:hypothetical protein
MSDEERRPRHLLIGPGSRALCGVLVRFWERVYQDMERVESALQTADADQPCEECLSVARSLGWIA